MWGRRNRKSCHTLAASPAGPVGLGAPLWGNQVFRASEVIKAGR